VWLHPKASIAIYPENDASNKGTGSPVPFKYSNLCLGTNSGINLTSFPA
jgi:hypothetical protein